MRPKSLVGEAKAFLLQLRRRPVFTLGCLFVAILVLIGAGIITGVSERLVDDGGPLSPTWHLDRGIEIVEPRSGQSRIPLQQQGRITVRGSTVTNDAVRVAIWVKPSGPGFQPWRLQSHADVRPDVHGRWECDDVLIGDPHSNEPIPDHVRFSIRAQVVTEDEWRALRDSEDSEVWAAFSEISKLSFEEGPNS